MIGFVSILKFFSVFVIFAGILSSLMYDVLLIIAEPFKAESWQRLAVDAGKVFLNSQEEIVAAVREFGTATTAEYKNFLLWRIVGGSLVTLGLLWILYQGISKIMPSTQQDLGARLIALLLAFLIVYAVGLVTSIIIGNGFVMPFSGWIELAYNRQEIINFMLERYQTTTTTTTTIPG